MRFDSYALATILATAIFFAGCGGDATVTGMDNDDDGGGGSGGTTRMVKADPSLSGDIWEMFVRNGCTSAGCHGGGAGGLTLDEAATLHSRLVNVSSSIGETLVIPGDTVRSYLVKRVDGRANPRMPLNRSPLDDIDLTNLKNWVNQGAKNN